MTGRGEGAALKVGSYNKRETGTRRDICRDGHVIIPKAETGVRHAQAKQCQELPMPTRSQQRQGRIFPSEPSGRP